MTQLCFNPSNDDLNPICYLLALLGAQHILHVSGLRVEILIQTRSHEGDNDFNRYWSYGANIHSDILMKFSSDHKERFTLIHSLVT